MNFNCSRSSAFKHIIVRQHPITIIFCHIFIRDINDIIARYCGTSSFVIPQLVFAVGLLAYSQDPSLGMEYISRAVTLAREIFGEDHIATARIQEKVGDVRVCWRVDV